MSQLQPRYVLRSLAFALAVGAVAYPAGAAKDTGSVKEAGQNLTDEDPRAALITLKNAVRKSPQDPAIHLEIARLYFQLGDAASAEREARAARDLKGDEAEYLPVLLDAMLARKEFKEIYDLVEPGDRNPVLESKVRTALGTAAVRLGYDTRAEALLRDAIKLDPSVVAPRIQLARFLSSTRPEEAVGVIDEAIAANPKSADLLHVKGDMLWSRGDANGALQAFGEALEIDPDYQLAHLSRANVNIMRGEFAAADQDLDPILRASPENFMANYLRGLEYVKQQNYIEADQIFHTIANTFRAFPYGYYVQATTKFALGQFGPAESILRDYLKHFPTDPNATRLIAQAALRQHGAPRAIDYLKPLADNSPPDAATLNLLGNAYMADGKPQAALQQFEKAAALDPENAATKARAAVAEISSGQVGPGLAKLEEVFSGEAGAPLAGPALVLAELRAGHVDKAAEVAKLLIKRDHGNLLYQILLGEVRVAQRDYAGAEAAFRAVLSRNPDFTEATRDLAQLYATTGRSDDAKRIYSDVLAEKPANTMALLGLAGLAIAERKWPEAIDRLNSARAAATYDPIPGLELVALYERLRDWNSAKAVAAELYAQFPRDVDVVVAFGRTRLESGDTNAAISSYKLAHQLAPDAAPIRSAYVALLKQAQYFREVLDVLKEAMIREPQNASLKADLMRADAEMDGVDAAISKAREFAASDPGNSIYDVVSAELYEKAGRGEEAVSLLENAVALRPADKALPPAFARLYVHMDLPAKAEAFLKARLKADPQDSAARSELAFYYVGQKNYAAAISEYARLVEDRPADPTALNNLACLYQRQGELKKARELAERAFKIAPRDAHIVDTLGWILVDQGEADAALTYLNAANLGVPQDLDIQYHLAVALYRVGRAADARILLENLLGSFGSFADRAEAEKLMQELKRS
jgi:putative PEP-CTERM system TPR-repeat lipoprotein